MIQVSFTSIEVEVEVDDISSYGNIKESTKYNLLIV